MIDYSKLLRWALAEAGGNRVAAVDLIVDAVEWAARLSTYSRPPGC